MSAASWTKAIILRRIAYGEADLVVTFFSREHGRMSGIARSARKSRKRFGGAFEPGTLVDMKFVERGASDLVRIEEAVVTRPAIGIMRSLARLAAMTRAVELALRFLQERQATPDKFDVLENYLGKLCAGEPSLSGHLAYQLTWTLYCGFGPCVSRCVRCGGDVANEKRISFDLDLGGSLCGLCSKTGLRQTFAASASQAGMAGISIGRSVWQALRDAEEGLAVTGNREAAAAIEVLDRYIAHIIGSPLVSIVDFGYYSSER